MPTGPITAQDFQDLWVSAVDSGYSRPFIEDPVASNFEAWQQAFAQFERMSTAIDVTTQSMFILPWSGQSNESARGAQLATVELTFTRTRLIDQSLILDPVLRMDEVTNDWGTNGPVKTSTGRFYSLLQPIVFNPGETGPFTGVAVAQRPGSGFNNPLPGTINTIDQPGKNLSNTLASYSYINGTSGDKLVADNRPDTPIPEHVGQYIRFTSGVNAGIAKRVIAYGPANASSDIGGVLYFESLGIVEGGFSPMSPKTFIPGEQVQIIYRNNVNISPDTLIGTGVFVKQSGVDNPVLDGGGITASFILKSGVLGPAALQVPTIETRLVGLTSGAILDYTAVILNPALPNDGNVSWDILGWDTAFGITVSNVSSPTGGRLAMLDELGRERRINRASGEGDDGYAERVHQIADTICPNAIIRAANRILAPYGLSVCFREAGLELLPGFYFDNDAYDYDFDVRPRLRNHTIFGFAEMRGYFRIGVPPLNWGEYGFAYDSGAWNAYDTFGTKYLSFYDGYAWSAAQLYKNVFQAINRVVAAGVKFDLYVERLGCDF